MGKNYFAIWEQTWKDIFKIENGISHAINYGKVEILNVNNKFFACVYIISIVLGYI